MVEITIGDCEILGSETVQAGKLQYETDVLRAPNPEGGTFKINHIGVFCPNCRAMPELAIELQTDSLYCPVCESRHDFQNSHILSGVYINDAQPA